MLTLKEVYFINEFTVYGDDENELVFYAVPPQPRLVMRENGIPHMSFIKYTDANGATSGALCIFDVEYCATPGDIEAIGQEMAKRRKGKSVVVRTPQYLDGSVKLLIKKDDKLIQEVQSSAKPSLVGTNMASFNAQLTREGAEVFGSALRNEGGFIQVAYELTMPVRFGSIEVTISYETEQLLNCIETIANRTSDGKEGYRQAVNSAYESMQLGRVDVNNTMAGVSEAFKERVTSEVTSWAMAELSKQMQNQLEKISGVTPDEKKRFQEMAQKDLEEHKGKGVGWWWWWHYELGKERRHELKTDFKEISNFEATYSQRSVFNWQLYPNGTLKPISEEQWKHVCTEVAIGEDPFFRKMQVPVNVNADFEDLKLFNVGVTVEYAGTAKTFTFDSNRVSGKNSAEFQANYKEGSGYEYDYSYEVNFTEGKGRYRSKKFRKRTGPLTINVAESGVLALDVRSPLPFENVGSDDNDINTVILELQSPSGEPYTFHRTIQIAEDFAEDDDGKIRIVLPDAHCLPSYNYRLTYVQSDGTKFSTDWATSSASILNIPPPIIESKRIVGVGFDAAVDHIDLELSYKDGEYVKEERRTLTTEEAECLWKLPVKGHGEGAWSYKATLHYKSAAGRKPKVVEVKSWTATTETVGVSYEDSFKVTIRAPEGFWSVVTFASLVLKYEDRERSVSVRKSFEIEKPAGGASGQVGTWEIPASDIVHDYEWETEYDPPDVQKGKSNRRVFFLPQPIKR